MPAQVTWPPETLGHFAEMSEITGLSMQLIQDTLSQPAAIRDELIAGWKALDSVGWTAAPDKLARVVELLNIVGTIAGVISGVAGAALAVAALRAL